MRSVQREGCATCTMVSNLRSCLPKNAPSIYGSRGMAITAHLAATFFAKLGHPFIAPHHRKFRVWSSRHETAHKHRGRLWHRSVSFAHRQSSFSSCWRQASHRRKKLVSCMVGRPVSLSILQDRCSHNDARNGSLPLDPFDAGRKKKCKPGNTTNVLLKTFSCSVK